MGNEENSMFSNLIIMIIFLVVAVASGLVAGMLYYNVNLLESSLTTINFDLPIMNAAGANENLTDFQDILDLVVYPLLGLADSLPYLVYFMIFGFIISIGMVAYLSSKNPLFFVLHILFTLVITYFCIKISNVYVGLLTNAFINNLMIPFTIYNKIMIYLPQIFFFTSILFGVIAFVNLMKPQTNNSMTGLNYGGDY